MHIAYQEFGSGDLDLVVVSGFTSHVAWALPAEALIVSATELHTGECEVIGNDIGGIAVHIAARVSALAGPDEILVSRTVRDLVAGSGITFEDRGRRKLKGVPDEWDVLAVLR